MTDSDQESISIINSEISQQSFLTKDFCSEISQQSCSSGKVEISQQSCSSRDLKISQQTCSSRDLKKKVDRKTKIEKSDSCVDLQSISLMGKKTIRKEIKDSTEKPSVVELEKFQLCWSSGKAEKSQLCSSSKNQDSEIRECGINSLSKVLKIEKNVSVIEKNIWKKCLEKLAISQRSCSSDDQDSILFLEEYYFEVVMQVVEDVLNSIKTSDILENIKQGKIGWEHHSYDLIKKRQEEQDDYLVNPFEIVEGVHQCKCGNKKIFSKTKQTRSSDEPMSVFCSCLECGNKWSYSG
jgi:DNA-directed RNA polymerase subunit M/transcription elongation factor TFIIS